MEWTGHIFSIYPGIVINSATRVVSNQWTYDHKNSFLLLVKINVLMVKNKNILRALYYVLTLVSKKNNKVYHDKNH